MMDGKRATIVSVRILAIQSGKKCRHGNITKRFENIVSVEQRKGCLVLHVNARPKFLIAKPTMVPLGMEIV